MAQVQSPAQQQTKREKKVSGDLEENRLPFIM
jgi:hypothetical protein